MPTTAKKAAAKNEIKTDRPDINKKNSGKTISESSKTNTGAFKGQAASDKANSAFKGQGASDKANGVLKNKGVSEKAGGVFKNKGVSDKTGGVSDKADGISEGENFDSSIKDLFISDLKDMYWSENHLVAAIPKMIDAAKGAALKKALTGHLKETVQHAKRLESVFEEMNIPIMPKKCDAMEGLTMSGEHVIENTTAGSAGREAGVIGSGIKVEQFEITCYEALINMANQLGLHKVKNAFQENLNEEIAASDKLKNLNKDAAKK